MRLLATTAIVLVLGSTGALAADAPDLIIDDEAIDMATDWDGVYIGVGVNIEQDLNGPDLFLGGTGILGANVTMDSFLLGGEVYVGGQFEISGGDPFGMLGGEIRAGVLVTEEVLLYGALGAEIITGGDTFGTASAGIEVMVSDNMSLDFEGSYVQGLNNGYQGVRGTASLNWFFN